MGWPKVKPGDDLAIPASLYNRMIDAVEAYLRAKGAGSAPATAHRPHQATVWVSNDSGGDLSTGAIVGLVEPIPKDPTDSVSEFVYQPLTFSGITPDIDLHVGQFAVTIGPISNGQVGRAIVQGVARVQVVFAVGTEEWADITDADSTKLTAADSGSARILWRYSSGAGTVWTVCLLTGGQDRCVAATVTDSAPGPLRSVNSIPHKLVGDNETQINDVYDIVGATIGANGAVTVAHIGNIQTGNRVAIAGIVGTLGTGLLNGNNYYVTIAGTSLVLFTDDAMTTHVDTTGLVYTSDGTVTHTQTVAAGDGWVEFAVIGADDMNQQVVAKHKHTGDTVDTANISGTCYLNNVRIDAGHITAVQMVTSGGLVWYDAFTGEAI